MIRLSYGMYASAHNRYAVLITAKKLAGPIAKILSLIALTVLITLYALNVASIARQQNARYEAGLPLLGEP